MWPFRKKPEVRLYVDGKQTPWASDHAVIYPGDGPSREIFYIKDLFGRIKRRLELGPPDCFDYSQMESGRVDAASLSPEQRELVCMTG